MQAVAQRIFAIQHRLNPLHVYCRFLDRGYGRNTSFCYCRIYEVAVFSWLSKLLRGALLLTVAGNGTERALRSRLAPGSDP